MIELSKSLGPQLVKICKEYRNITLDYFSIFLSSVKKSFDNHEYKSSRYLILFFIETKLIITQIILYSLYCSNSMTLSIWGYYYRCVFCWRKHKWCYWEKTKMADGNRYIPFYLSILCIREFRSKYCFRAVPLLLPSICLIIRTQ